MNTCDAEQISDVSTMSLTELADHIERTHHDYVRGALCRVAALLGEMVPAHGGKEPRLERIRATFRAMAGELWSHMMKEEMCLFPMIRQLEGGKEAPMMHLATISHPIRQMESDHDEAEASLKTLRKLTDGFSAPEWACDKYRTMLEELRQFEQNMHVHIHKENDVLFPRALELEARQAQGSPVS